MENYYLNERQINKLKEDLMNKEKKSENRSNISSEYYKMKNKDVGLYLEENIRNTLMLNYRWKKKNISRKLIYCDIKYDNESHIITNISGAKITISKKEVFFNINKDKSLDILIDNNHQKIKTQKETKKTIVDKECIITERKEMENDGWFEIKDFDINEFDKSEICVLHKNAEPHEIKNAKQAIIETKLSRDKINELLNQLNRDKFIAEKIEKSEKGSIIYVGFINSKSINYKLFFEEILPNFKDLKFILFGIKNSIFGKRKITEFYDWESIKNIKALEKNVNGLAKKLNGIDKKLNIIIKKFSFNEGDNDEDNIDNNKDNNEDEYDENDDDKDNGNNDAYINRDDADDNGGDNYNNYNSNDYDNPYDDSNGNSDDDSDNGDCIDNDKVDFRHNGKDINNIKNDIGNADNSGDGDDKKKYLRKKRKQKSN